MVPSPKIVYVLPEGYFFVDLDEMPVPQLEAEAFHRGFPSIFLYSSGVALDRISPPAHLPGTMTSECLTLCFRHIVLILRGTELAASALQCEPKNRLAETTRSGTQRQLGVELGIESLSPESQ